MACVAATVLAMIAPAAALGAAFTAPRSFPAGDGPVGIAVGDFNADGDLDMAVADQFTHKVSVLLGGAGGGFSQATEYGVGPRPIDVAIGDFNGDGDPDLAVASSESRPDHQGGRTAVLLGAAGGSFGSANIITTGGDTTAVAVGEFNQDNDPDLAIAEGNDNALVMLGGADGGFGAFTPYATADHPGDIAVADFNADGDPDIVTPNQGSDDVSVLLGGSGGSFGTLTNFSTGNNGPYSIGVGDFNGDNDRDLAVGHWDPGRLSILLGGAGGSFGAPSTVASEPGTHTGVAVGDLNGDGDLDLAVSGVNAGVMVLLGGAGASFGPPAVYPSGGSTGAVAIGDFNGDSDPDLVVANTGEDAVSVLLNTAHRPAAPTFAGTDPASPANANGPRVRGTAAAGTIVSLYPTNDCSGPPAAIGSAAEFASPGLIVSVPDDSTTTLRAIATNSADVPSDCSSQSLTYVEHSSPPGARVTVSPNPALTGVPIAFDASSSTGFGIVRFEWDLDGDGTFEVDGGPAPTTSRTYTAAGELTPGVRVSNDLGSSVARLPLSVRLAPPPGALGVSINGGAQFTNDARVSVATVWPPLARTLRISNDGGFADPGIFPVAAQTAWTLESSGPERLPKTVYVRFDDASQNFTDDIILDETSPQVVSATASGGGAGASAAASAARTFRVRVQARDRTSGVRGLQVTANRRKPGKLREFKRTLRFRRAVRFRTSSSRIYVRVRDAAGNFSRWRTAAQRPARKRSRP